MFKITKQTSKVASLCTASGLLVWSRDNRRPISGQPPALLCDAAVVPPPPAAAKPVASWGSYVSPTAWYQWGTLSADDYHFQRYASSNGLKGLMSWPTLQNGLSERVNDEDATRQKIADFQQFLANNPTMDGLEMKRFKDELYLELTELMYGKGMTAERRQEHLAMYGCAMYTDESLACIARVAEGRGVVEIGAGNGQWARQLQDRHNVDIVAFDSMASVPSPFLPGKTAAESREESRKYFAEVMQGDQSIFHPPDRAAARGLTGRALMIVFPDQGEMAYDCLRSYVSSSSKNDLFIYVGEGRGGANGSDLLFDWLESGEWNMEACLPLAPFGSKGYERFFVFSKK